MYNGLPSFCTCFIYEVGFIFYIFCQAEFIMSGLDNPVVRGLVTAEGLNLTDKVIKVNIHINKCLCFEN